MGGASTAPAGAAAGAGLPPKMSPSRPRSEAPADTAGAAAAGAPPPPPRRSRRSPPPPPPTGAAICVGAGAAEGVVEGPSSRSVRSRRSFPPPPPPPPPPLIGAGPEDLWTSSMELSPMARLSPPPMSPSGTGMRSRIPAREPSHSRSRSSKNSQERCCRSVFKLDSNLRRVFRMRSTSLGQRVTSFTRAEATKHCVAWAFSGFGGFLATSCSMSTTSAGETRIGWLSGPMALPDTKWSPNSPMHQTPTFTRASWTKLSFMLKYNLITVYEWSSGVEATTRQNFSR
mmetsp:Transcript_61378/g.129481  ORF Transcript_61378/g.129481 Transcript_61378/m.129481 type:complete len:286 (+) Transcript_61378:388-1245(+)